MNDNLPDLNRLAPFVSGLGKSILQELIEDMAAIEKDRERQSVPALTDDWIKRHSMLGADCVGASTVVLASSLRRLIAAAPQPQRNPTSTDHLPDSGKMVPQGKPK